MNSKLFLSISFLMLATALKAQAVTLTFDDLKVGTTLSDQYSDQGVSFSANAFAGAGGPTGPWGTNTDMTVVSLAGSDVSGLGAPSLASGNVLRSYNGFLSEDGDPSIRITFQKAVSAISVDFAGVSNPDQVQMLIYDGDQLVQTVKSDIVTGQFTLSLQGAQVTSVVILPGSVNDWVAIDNVTFTP